MSTPSTIHQGWAWLRNETHWAVADSEWFELYKMFRKSPVSQDPRKQTAPVNLQLGDVRVQKTDNQLYVRHCYAAILDRVEAIRLAYPSSGVVITGQPGTGKSLWLFYALEHFLNMNQNPVLFYYKSSLLLFYDNSVYERTHESAKLPFHRGHLAIIALLDTDNQTDAPPSICVDRDRDTFPIHATSPNTSRYRFWSQRRSATIIGMPLWSRDELIQGLEIHAYYNPLKLRLIKHMSGQLSAPNDIPLEEDHAAALKGVDDLDKAVKRLLDWAISQFGSPEHGSSARDVLDALEHAAPVRKRHDDAKKELTNSKILQYLLQVSPSADSADPKEASHQIISLIPHPEVDRYSSDKFEVAFKSKPIGDHVIQKLKRFQYEEVLQLIDFCREVPGGPSLSGVIFEGVAHRILAGNLTVRKAVLKAFQMSKGGTSDAPSFTMLPLPYDSDFLSSLPAREIASVDFDEESPYNNFPMNEKYFVPISPSNPFLDSLSVDYSKRPNKQDEVLVNVWVFQVTLTPRHAGSSQGYGQIGTFVKAANSYAETWLNKSTWMSGPIWTTRTRTPKVTVVTTVHYILVCPHEAETRRWAMPSGWQDAQEGVTSKAACFLIDLERLPASVTSVI